MSSINPHFTISYSQPEEYRFSHDSVFLARRVYEIVAGEGLKCNKILDLCSGSGVVGLDFMFHLKKNGIQLPEVADFLEIQQEYSSHFEINKETSGFSQFCNFLNRNYNEITQDPAFQNRYDLALCNPPYFRVGHGALSPSEFKNRCRFYIDSSFETLLKAIEYTLVPGGKAFILTKNLNMHGLDIQSELTKSVSKLNVFPLEKVREADLYQLTKV